MQAPAVFRRFDPAALAGILNTTAKLIDPFGSALGGMVVRMAGLDADGKPAERAWHPPQTTTMAPRSPVWLPFC